MYIYELDENGRILSTFANKATLLDQVINDREVTAGISGGLDTTIHADDDLLTTIQRVNEAFEQSRMHVL